MKKLAIIGNAKAGKGNLSQLFLEARRVIWGWPCDFLTPSSTTDLTSLCASLDPNVYEAAVVIGGDGTIHHAVRGLSQGKIPLYAFPGGTANDLASELGTRADWAQVQQLINERQPEPIDLIDVNGIPFATVAGIGLGAALTEDFNQRRQSSKLFKAAAIAFKSQVYTLLSVRTICMNWGQSRTVHVESGSFSEKIKTSAIFVCNQARLGGDLTVGHGVSNNDQRLNVLIIPRASGLSMMQALLALKKGVFPEDFICLSSNHVRLTDTRGEDLSVFGDGESLLDSSTLDFKILPSQLQVYSAREKKARAAHE